MRWLDRRDELKGNVRGAYEANDRTKDNVKGVLIEEDRSHKDVDCLESAVAIRNWGGLSIQTPRPMKEKRKEA